MVDYDELKRLLEDESVPVWQKVSNSIAYALDAQARRMFMPEDRRAQEVLILFAKSILDSDYSDIK